jgi:hypothetical protein
MNVRKIPDTARALCIIWPMLFLMPMSVSYCYSADLIFIRSTGGSSPEQEQLEIATNFYGLDIKVFTVSSANSDTSLASTIEREETVGVAIAANALASVNHKALVQALGRKRGNSVPVIVLGVTSGVDPILLRTWSGEAVSGCAPLEDLHRAQYIFGRIDGFTWQLADLKVPFTTKRAFYMTPGESSMAQRIISLQHNEQVSPVFIQTTVQRRKVFVACAISSDADSIDGTGVVNSFLRTAPAMLFTRYCAGEQGWHALHHYANLTIDDAWLRQPYGYVDYSGLLAEMEKHNFTTTIGFIPWNFGRSEPGVVSLFGSHPERFSIAIHGDNHDHMEFRDYRSKPLTVQIACLRQSLARMERFRTLTGIQYDKVMIFPHSIAPEKTLEALKTYNYLATVNIANIPQDAIRPSAPSFDLRPVTLSFAGFPSLTRYAVPMPLSRNFIAINEFLDNPLLFFCHSEFFATGVGAFDSFADEVNKLEPSTRWLSVGNIIRHLYVIRLRGDSGYDVLAFSSDVSLENTTRRDAVFYLRKQEIGGQTIESVTVDGQPYEYRIQGGYLNLTVPVAMGNTRSVQIQYKNDLELAPIDISHDSLIVYFLRMGSDFRDIFLSKLPGGLVFIRFYNEDKLKLALVLGCLFALVALCAFAAYRLRVISRKRRSVPIIGN